jgi:hypothetical protein
VTQPLTPVIAPTPPLLPAAFAPTRFRFTSGVRAGEITTIRDGEGNDLLSYRSFATIVPIVGALMAGIVLVTGAAATLFLFMEGRVGAAIASIALSLGFSGIIAALIPAIRVTLYNGETPALVIAQKSRVPFRPPTYVVTTAEGAPLATLKRSAFSRFGRTRWTIDAPTDQRGVAWAVEESLRRAMGRKIAGKFQRRFQTNIRIMHHGGAVGTIIRRPQENGEYDVLEVSPAATLDRRVAVALATLVFGSEP